MYLFVIAFIFLIIYLYSSSIIEVIFSIKTNTANLNTGVVWFIALIIINILITMFIIGYYHFKRNKAYGAAGKKGFDGKPGLEGEADKMCNFLN